MAVRSDDSEAIRFQSLCNFRIQPIVRSEASDHDHTLNRI